MALDKNNNRSIVRQLALRSVRTSGRSSLLTILTIALTAILISAMILQAQGMVDSQKKMLARAQEVIYTNLTLDQIAAIADDERVSSTIANKIGQGVEAYGVLLRPCYYEPATQDMDSYQLTEGRMAEAIDEIALDRATLRAFNLPEVLGTQITVHFLNRSPETFTVVGLSDYEAGGDKLPVHNLYLSRVYAEEGPQLTATAWALLAQMQGGAEMQGPTLKNLVYQVGEDYGVAHQNVNPNDMYIQLRTVSITNLLLYLGLAAALTIVSFSVIYSIFYLSVAGRVRQFGQLRTIGMTPKQLRRMVKQEGWLLWAIGTPLGFAFASLLMLAFGPQGGWGLSNNVDAFIASALVCAVAVRLGVQKPAALAAAATPIEASRFQEWHGQATYADSTSRELTPWGLAKLNFARSWKKQVLTLLSLAIGGILFMAAACYITAWQPEAYSRQGQYQDSEYIIHFDYNTENSLENGTSAMQLQGLLGQDFQSALLQLPGVEAVTAYHGVSVRTQWGEIKDNEYLTPFEHEDAAILEKYLQAGVGSYDALVQSGGLFVSQSGQWKEIYGKVPQIGDEFVITYYNGQMHTVTLPVVGVGGDYIASDLIGSSWLLIPRETATALFGDMDTTKSLTISMKEDSHTAAQDEMMHTFLSSYPQLDLNTLNDQLTADASSYAMVKAMFIGIGGFVVLFSLVNLLNTILASLMARRQQLAMLAALGMTRRQISKMLNLESLLIAGINLTATLTLGTFAGWNVCQLMVRMKLDYIHFTFPTIWFFLYAAITIAVPVLITLLCLHRFYKESLTERLRTMEP